jgi:hypothetical protein
MGYIIQNLELHVGGVFRAPSGGSREIDQVSVA